MTLGPDTVAPLSDAELAQHAPDRHLRQLDGPRLTARASCWWTNVPALPEHRLGIIGHYAASDKASGVEILQKASRCLLDAGCTIAIGPIDGNTWRRYRLIVERGTEPPFFLEPDNPDVWPTYFERAGFERLATYTSTLTTDLTRTDERVAAAEERIAREGITIRPLRLDAADLELRNIFQLSLQSFAQNYLYSPISEEEFLDQNRRVLPFVVPELVLMAEREDALVGYVFALPDVLRKQRGAPVDTFIVKTLAVAPGIGGMGLGGLLVNHVQRRASHLGFTRAIHALMHEKNVSQRIGGHYARTIRRYALFGRLLRPTSTASG